MAREALEASLAGGRPPQRPESVALRARHGAFVTLESGGALRGCMGRARADRPLGELVGELAVAAARDDPRFTPVSFDELRVVRIEISVLTEPQMLRPVQVAHIVIGRDGLFVRRLAASGILLPQVAREQGWDPDAFLAAACRKAGLAAHAWREPGTDVFTFQADVFGEGAEMEGRSWAG